jgi:CubicO group peptidase (beta-lactamase class C family)
MSKILMLLLLQGAMLISGCKSGVDPDKTAIAPPVVHDSALTTMLDSLRYAHKLPALAGAVVADTGVVEAQAAGCRRWGGAANVTADDQFHLGSNTKALTAVLIGMLIDDGLIGWNTTLPVIFPECEATMLAQYRQVTVHDLLCHAAGLVTDPSVKLAKKNLTEQRMEVVFWALKQPPANARGTYRYSNTGYIIAGAIVDKLTGRTFEEMLLDRVLKPLGITTVGFGPMGTPGLEDQPLQHDQYYRPYEPEENADNPPIYNSAGRLHLSIGDWGRYIAWVLACEAGRPTLVSAATARKLTEGGVAMEGEGRYACGWAVVERPWADGRALTHAGSNTWNFSVAWLAPNRRFAVMVETNICTDATPAVLDAIVWQLIEYHLGEL